jgi:polar amino acid transport system substrate-binding protein
VKTIFRLILSLFLPVILAGTALGADSQLTAVTKILGELRVGVLPSSAIFSFRENNGSPYVGHQVDLAKQFASDMNVELQLYPEPLESLLERLEKGEIDIIMAAIPMNAETAKRVAFTDPWGFSGIVPITGRARRGKFSNWRDLTRSDVRIGVPDAPAIVSQVNRILPGKQIVRITTIGEMLNSLATDKIDVLLTNNVEASILVRDNPRIEPAFTSQPLLRRPLAFLVKLEDHTWLHYVNTWLRVKKETAFLDSLNRTWGLLGQ